MFKLFYPILDIWIFNLFYPILDIQPVLFILDTQPVFYPILDIQPVLFYPRYLTCSIPSWIFNLFYPILGIQTVLSCPGYSICSILY